MKKTIPISIGIIVLLGALFFFGKQSSEQTKENDTGAQEETAIETSESSFDFGTISMAKGKVSRIFKIKNAGAESIGLKKLYTSCMCTTASYKKGEEKRGPFGMPGHGIVPPLGVELGSNEEAEVEVVFDPAAHGPAGVGMIERVVTFETESGKVVNLGIKANVTP